MALKIIIRRKSASKAKGRGIMNRIRRKNNFPGNPVMLSMNDVGVGNV